jgi:universal stress protein E
MTRRLDRILAVLDPTSDAQPALLKAAFLAERSGATLELFACDFDPSLSGQPFFDTEKLGEMRKEFIAERLEWLEDTADQLRDRGLAIETHVHWDNPLYRGIVSRVEESSPDMVVKDTHYHSALRRALFTNTDWNLIRSCPAPLLLAKPGSWKKDPCIVAALDPGHRGDKPAALDHDILDYAQLVAGVADGELHAVHAFFPAALLAATTGVPGLPVVPGAPGSEIIETERRQITESLAEICRSHGLEPDRVRLEQGFAVELLPRLAETLAADLLVMGAISRSRLRELFIGSTAERILDRLHCDVLIVKPGDFAEGLPS